MDESQLDDLARSFATNHSRRTLLKGLLAGSLGLLGYTGRRDGASAAPAISLTPSAGPVRTRVTVALAGFRRFEPFEIRWYNGNAYQVVAASTATRSGIRTVSFSVPNTWRGTHIVRAVGTMGSSADASFRVKQSIELQPASAERGDPVRAILRGFRANAVLEIRFFATTSSSSVVEVIGQTTVSSTGTGTVTFAVPAGAAIRSHRIEGKERVSGVLAAGTFVVRCGSASDCPEPSGECRMAICADGVCGAGNRPANDTAESQVTGDCRKRVCDGAGGVIEVDDDTDAPTATGQCVDVSCTDGSAEQTPKTVGSTCDESGGSVCDGDGNCVECVSHGDCDGGTCIEHVCVADFCVDASTCDDGIACTVDACNEEADTCTHTPVDGLCNDGNQCTSSTCNPAIGCVHAPLPAGTECSQNGGAVCNADGQCVAAPVCTPHAARPCYTGPAGTQDVGICRAGTQTCASDGTAWGACTGEVLPATETCNGLDDDCEGADDNGATCPDGLNARGACVSGACTLVCDAGYSNCSGDAGCETHVANDPANCGACGIPCSPFEICLNGICTNG